MTEQLVAELVYTGSVPRELPLLRPRGSRFTVELASSLRADGAVVQAHERAASLISQATEGRVVFSVGDCASDAGIRVTSGATAAQGEARRRLDAQGYVIGGEILCRDNSFAARFDVALHEMGHIYGLQHGSGNIVMCGAIAGQGECRGPLPIASLGQFTPQERLIMRLMLLRTARTVFPDDDRNASPAPVIAVIFD